MTKWHKLREKLEDNIDECERYVKLDERITRYPNTTEKYQIYIDCYKFVLQYMKLLQDEENQPMVQDEAQ